MDTQVIQELQTLLEELTPVLNGSGHKAFLRHVAIRLSEAVGKSPPWSYNYILGILNGNLGASKKFIRAMRIVGAMQDGIPGHLADLEQVTVYAPAGQVHPNTVILSASRLCKRPACRVWFIPKSGNQDYCCKQCRIVDYHDRGSHP